MEMIQNHESLTFACYRFTLRPIGGLELPPYKGSAIRGAFMNQFRRTVCVTRAPECTGCLLSGQCAYFRIFETEAQVAGPGFLGNVRKVPHPFVLEPPLDRRTVFREDDTLSLHLVLIGHAIDYLPYFIYTVEEMGRLGMKWRGKFRLEAVNVLDAMQNPAHVYDGQTRALRQHSTRISIKDLDTHLVGQERVSLQFLTPTRIVAENRLRMDLTFDILIQSLTRRLDALSAFHCGAHTRTICNPDGVNVEESRLRWHDWERYSNRQKTKMKLGGFVGKIVFAGNVQPYMKILKLGELLHVGKGTSFGLGQYILN